jgi:hypothetical protein
MIGEQLTVHSVIEHDGVLIRGDRALVEIVSRM